MSNALKTEYTRTPWIIRDRFPNADFNAQIISLGGLSDGNNAIIVDQIHSRANAELIVRAVNSYDELLEENKRLRGALATIVTRSRTGIIKKIAQVALNNQKS